MGKRLEQLLIDTLIEATSAREKISVKYNDILREKDELEEEVNQLLVATEDRGTALAELEKEKKLLQSTLSTRIDDTVRFEKLRKTLDECHREIDRLNAQNEKLTHIDVAKTDRIEKLCAEIAHQAERAGKYQGLFQQARTMLYNIARAPGITEHYVVKDALRKLERLIIATKAVDIEPTSKPTELAIGCE